MTTLLYPRPKASDYDVHRLLHDLQEREPVFRAYLDDPEALVGSYGVDDEAARLVVERDYDGLVARGLHPILVVALKRRIDWGTSLSAAAGDEADESGADEADAP